MKQIEASAAIIHDSQGRIFATQRGYGEYYAQYDSHNTIPKIELVQSFIEKVDPELKANNYTQKTEN